MNTRNVQPNRVRRQVARLGLVFTSLCAPFWGCGETVSEHDATPHQHIASAECPLKTPAMWQRFLEAAVDDPTWGRTCSDQNDCELATGAFAENLRQERLGVFEQCREDLSNNPPVAKCSRRFRRFAAAWLRQHASDSYGFEQPNHEYLAAQLGEGTPEHMLDPPSALLAALPERAALEAVARSSGWPYLTHGSALGGVRTFVVVTDAAERFEQWILFGLDLTATQVDDASIISFLAVQTKTAAGVPLPQPRLHFRDYLARAAAKTWRLELPENFPGKCYACHTSGLRQLLVGSARVTASAPVAGEPDYGQATVPSDYGLRRLESFNQRLAAYGMVDWGKTLVPSHYGPALGQELGCTDCHNGKVRGSLTLFTSEGTIWQKVVGQLAMQTHRDAHAVPDLRAMQLLERAAQGTPPLSPSEAQELESARASHLANYDQFMNTRLRDWKAWILEIPCDREP